MFRRHQREAEPEPDKDTDIRQREGLLSRWHEPTNVRRRRRWLLLSTISFRERCLDKGEQLSRRWIAGCAQVTIEPDVIGSSSPECFRLHSRFPEFAPQPVRLGGSVGMVGHMQIKGGI